MAVLYSSSNVFVQVCLNVSIGNNGTVTTQYLQNKSFLSVSLHCFKCNYSVKLSVLSVISTVVLHIEQFDYTFACFV